MRELDPEFAALGVAVRFVIIGDRDKADQFCSLYGMSERCLADPDKSTYAAMGLESYNLLKLFTDPALKKWRAENNAAGFKQNWANDEIAEFQIGAYRFLLQTFYVKEHAGNFMMSLLVEDADIWWKHITDMKLPEKYPGIMAKPPAMQPWGLRVLYLSDPSGVLWHIQDQRKS